MDYGRPERRKTKKDLKRKKLFNVYKRGGKFRTTEIKEDGSKKEECLNENSKRDKKDKKGKKR